MEKERRAIYDALYKQLQNTDGHNKIENKINVLKSKDDNTLFASWDHIIKKHIII